MSTPGASYHPETRIDSSADPAEGHAAADWLLVGKLAPPQQRITAVSRDALLSRLNESLSRSLSVIVSPPGFGKTTLLTQWWRTLGARSDLRACWLTVDDLDSEVSRFIAGVILSVARAGVAVGLLEVAARQQSIDPNVRPVALVLLETIRRSGRRTVLILDDFHRARSRAVDEAVEMLIEHSHGELHVVVSGRTRPTFRVSALLARGLVTRLDASDLALSLEEASEIMGPGVSPSDLALWHARTEGWAVALQLARLWLDRGGYNPDALKDFSGRTTEMTDYLAEQIVADLPEPLREFLLETCILERFNARLADAVRERSDSEDLLEQLRHFDALLIPLDNAREWFRYHPLFADYLYQRLKRSLAQRPVILRRRAARVLAEVGDLPEAVQHAVAADDIDLAVTLTQQAGGWELILWKGIGYVRRLLECFDEVTIRAKPALQLTQAYLDIKLARFEAARELLALAATTLDTAGPRTRRDFVIVQSLWQGYVDQLADKECIAAVEAHCRGLDPSDHLGRGTLTCEIAVAALGQGALERAEAESRRAIQEMRASGSILGLNYAFLHLAQSELLGGRLREAETLLREALVMAEDNFGADSGLKALCSSFLGYCLYLKGGDHETSDRLIESLAETTAGLPGKARQRVDGARSEFRAAKLLLPARRLDALSILILKLRGAHEEALARLQDLLEFVASEGAIGILLEQGRGLESVLNIAQRRNRELVLSGAQRELISQVLSRLRRAAVADQDGFSARELAVLRELWPARSHKTIGQYLDLSENTVKFHLKRIFKKLGAESRAEAISAALQGNLVVVEDIESKR